MYQVPIAGHCKQRAKGYGRGGSQEKSVPFNNTVGETHPMPWHSALCWHAQSNLLCVACCNCVMHYKAACDWQPQAQEGSSFDRQTVDLNSAAELMHTHTHSILPQSCKILLLQDTMNYSVAGAMRSACQLTVPT
jgi:hypothetical protein